MSAVILLAMPSDHHRMRNIVGALSENDLDVYWERTAPDSPKWAQTAAEVMNSRAIVLFWSAAADLPENEPYRVLARRAVSLGIAICVRLDGAALPEALRGCSVYDLRGWRARASGLFMLDLVAAVRAKAAGLDPPLPRAPRVLLFRWLAFVIPSIVAAGALLIGLYRDIGMDRIASGAEARAWAAVRPGSCDDLQTFLSAHSGGVYAAEAQALLASGREQTQIRRRRAERPLPLYVPSATAEASGTEPLARTAALTRATPMADQLCRGLASAGDSHFVSVQIRADRYECDRFGSGMACALSGTAICSLDEPEEVRTRTCTRR